MDQTFTFNVPQLHEFELQSICKGLEQRPSKVVSALLKAPSLTTSETAILADYALSFPEVKSAYYDEHGLARTSPFPPGTLVVAQSSVLMYQGQVTKLVFKRLDENVYRVDWT